MIKRTERPSKPCERFHTMGPAGMRTPDLHDCPVRDRARLCRAGHLGTARRQPGRMAGGRVRRLLGGAIVVIVAASVLNDAVDAMDPNGPGSASAWARYYSRWTAWTHVRAATSLAAAGLLT